MAPHQSISALRLFVYVTAAAAVVTAVANYVTYLYAAPLAGSGVAILICAPIAGRGGMWGVMGAVLAVMLAAFGGPAIAEYGRVAHSAPVEIHDASIDLAAMIRNVHYHPGHRASRVFEHAIAPIVPQTYAACHDLEADRCMDTWQTPTSTFVPVHPDEVRCYLAMLPPASDGSPATGPVTFVYHVAPEAYLGQLRRDWLRAIYIPALAWLLIGGLVATRNTLTMRRLAAIE